MSAALVLLAAGLAAAGGVPGLFARGRRAWGQHTATGIAVLASLVGLAGAAAAIVAPRSARLSAPWALPGAHFSVEVDGLSTLFLIPLFVVSGLGAIYSETYWSQREHPGSARRVRLFYGLVTAGIAIVFVARNTIFFLVGWEVMALSAFFLVSAEEEKKKEARAAGWLYLIATHAATLALFALFALLRHVAGSFDLAPLPAGVAGSPAGRAIFLLALAAFGTKAGLMPFHVWLPSAHAATPSHVSALMSGVLIKTGIYGLVRLTSLFPDPPAWWGGALLAAGVVSGVLGVAFALGQHDLKRLLAYHSVENIGIIAIGLGLGLAGRAAGEPVWALLGFAGGLLHVVNHGLFKSLLFLGAGSVVHASGTREMDRLGGLLKILPRTALWFLVGAVAICGLPPLNGFVSEFLIYLGLLSTLKSAWIWAAFAVPALALVGALALACFVKAFGAVFLGQARADAPLDAHEHALLTGAMAVLAALCLGIGVAPFAVAPLVERAARDAAPGLSLSLSETAPLGILGAAAVALVALLALAALLQRSRLTPGRLAAAGTWDCGYAAPSARMQYTSSSFASWTVGFFRFALLPRTRLPELARFFPRSARFESHVGDTVLDRLLTPAFEAGAWLASWGRFLQHGRIQLYLVYVAVTLVALLWKV
jgi:hydrogenase-4 component B